jgi:16S rRNA processing protein RimM
MDRLVAAGKVGGLFGAKGEVTLSLYDVFPREPNMEEPVFVKIDSHTVPLFFQSFRRRGQRGATAVFEDIDSEARAAELVGLEFYIREGGESRSRASEEDGDELYLEDLTGWDFEFDTGQTGHITDFIDSDFNPLFEIEIGGETELIPASDDFIVEFDECRRKVVFSLPEGLLGLNK